VVSFSLRKEAQTKMKNERKNKHMTFDDRLAIQGGLSEGLTFKAIAERIGKSPTTVSREVKAHLHFHTNRFVKTAETCPLLLKAPFVCNNCKKRNHSNCHFKRQIYLAKPAQSEYESLLVEARTGIPLNKESFYETEKIISNAVRKGQHIYHAIKANDIHVSVSTVYRHIKKGYYSISPLDLPRMVKFKPRRKTHTDYVPYTVKQNRKYDNYLAFTDMNPDISVVQFDTVIGRIGGKVILTVHFTNWDFMIGILLNNKTGVEAAAKITELKSKLRSAGFSFGDIIPVILTDNGGEFSNVDAFEKNENGDIETSMFFCEPNASYEKPHIEKNHTLFRDIVPSGSSFDSFTQETVNLIFSHVNAVKRKQFNGKSAYDMFTFAYSVELAEVLGIKCIPANEVIQTPVLLR